MKGLLSQSRYWIQCPTSVIFFLLCLGAVNRLFPIENIDIPENSQNNNNNRPEVPFELPNIYSKQTKDIDDDLLNWIIKYILLKVYKDII